MDREIKFRAWDGEKMIYEGGDSMNYLHSYEILRKYENTMQFTGLKDQHQEEIYEGKSSVSLTIIGLGEGIADVVMKDGMWQVYEPSQGYAPLFDLLNNSSVIIKAL